MNTRVRHTHIDFIKAIATVVVMITHVLAYHLGEYPTWFLWNYSHFVVVGLVFCSAYLYADRYATETTQLTVSWFFRRFSRLYIPYIIYVCIHSFLMNVFPHYFFGYGWQKTLPFFIQNILLIGGVDFGWLPVLFIQLALLSPILLRIARNKIQRNFYLFFVGIGICITVFARIPSAYTRLIGWLPWSYIAVLGFLYSDQEKRNSDIVRSSSTLIWGTGISIGIFFMFHMILIVRTLPYSFDMHKYPPDISYLSYGAIFTCLLLLWKHIYPSGNAHIENLMTFISANSYQLFFVHFLFLDLVMTRLRGTWITESAIVVIGALVTTKILAILSLRLRKSHYPTV